MDFESWRYSVRSFECTSVCLILLTNGNYSKRNRISTYGHNIKGITRCLILLNYFSKQFIDTKAIFLAMITCLSKYKKLSHNFLFIITVLLFFYLLSLIKILTSMTINVGILFALDWAHMPHLFF